MAQRDGANHSMKPGRAGSSQRTADMSHPGIKPSSARTILMFVIILPTVWPLIATSVTS